LRRIAAITTADALNMDINSSGKIIVHRAKGVPDTGRIKDNQSFHHLELMPVLCKLTTVYYPEQ